MLTDTVLKVVQTQVVLTYVELTIKAFRSGVLRLTGRLLRFSVKVSSQGAC